MKSKNNNNLKVRRIGRKYKALPPHTWEAHPTANQGEANKTLIIAVVAIVAVLALALLLFFSSTFVGKAIEVGTFSDEGQAGSSAKGTVNVGEEFNLPVSVFMSHGQLSVAFKLSLSYNHEAVYPSCDEGKIFEPVDKLFSENGQSFNVVRKASCENGVVNVEYASLFYNEQHSIHGQQALVNIPFKAIAAQNPKFEVHKVDLYDYKTTQLISLTLLNPQISISSGCVDQCSNFGDVGCDINNLTACDEINCLLISGIWANNACTMPEAESLVTLKVTKDGLEVDKFTTNAQHLITATLKPSTTALSSHLVFIKVVDKNDLDQTSLTDSKTGLAINSEETAGLQFTPTAAGNYTVKVFAWSNWLDLGGQPITGASLEVEYESE